LPEKKPFLVDFPEARSIELEMPRSEVMARISARRWAGTSVGREDGAG
jgi:hypothetical protein